MNSFVHDSQELLIGILVHGKPLFLPSLHLNILERFKTEEIEIPSTTLPAIHGAQQTFANNH